MRHTNFMFLESMSKTFGLAPIYSEDLSDSFLEEQVEECRKNSQVTPEMNAFFGIKHSEKSKKIMSESAKSRPCNRKGAVLSEETKSLISKNNAAKKTINTPYGTFQSKVEAADALNTTTEAIRCILNEKIDTPIKRKSKFFTREQIGKTPRELGWDYV